MGPGGGGFRDIPGFSWGGLQRPISMPTLTPQFQPQPSFGQKVGAWMSGHGDQLSGIGQYLLANAGPHPVGSGPSFAGMLLSASMAMKDKKTEAPMSPGTMGLFQLLGGFR